MQKKSLLWSLLNLFVKKPGVLSSGLVRFGKVSLIGVVVALGAAPVWGEALTPTGLVIVVAGLVALEKLVKEKFGVGV